MNLSRREFLQALAYASITGLPIHGVAKANSPGLDLDKNYYKLKPFGNVSFMHMTDCHAQLVPAYYREPNFNIGMGDRAHEVPHLVGDYLLQKFNISRKSATAHSLTHLNFPELAQTYGRMGGFAHIATLVKELRASRPGSLLLDGGDTWQGSATALWTKGQDMIDACVKLGVDVMTGHWEFTYGMERVLEVIEKDFKGKIDFVAQNVLDLEFEDPVFKPYVMKEMNGVPVAIIGQAFPFTPIANPRHMVEKWQFGIKEDRLQEIVEEVRGKGAQVVVLLSHDGLDLDIKLASRVTGIDAIFSGHTHDAVPTAIPVKNSKGTTLVTNPGSAGKFLSVMDFDVRNGKIKDFRYKLVPVFSNMIPADKDMQAHIDAVRKPYASKLKEELAISTDMLYRRGTFNGTFDQLICDALIETQSAEIAFSPGFRWGMTTLPGEAITYEDVMTQTAITYPQVTRNPMKGDLIKSVLEDIADNRFNVDPYSQQGGDMVRVGGLEYVIDPLAKHGQRIRDMHLNGKKIDANKEYIVAGWASVQKDVKGKPVYDVVADYLRNKKVISIKKLNEPKVLNLKKNDTGYQKA